MSYPPQGSTTEIDGHQVRQELADTRKKLQDYADTIVSLYGELRTLRENICSTCKRNFVPSQAADCPSFVDQVSSSQVAKRTNSTSPGHPLPKAHASDDYPSSSDLPTSKIHTSTSRHIPQTLISRPLPILATPTHIRVLSPLPVPTTVHGNEKPASVSYPLPLPTTTSGNRTVTIPNTLASVPRWFVKRNATADAVLDVAFVCAFGHKNWVRSVRFSADGKYLAAALGDIKGHNGRIVIYDVETGKKHCALVENASRYQSQARPNINSLSFSPAGRYLVAGDMTGRVTVWDLPNKRIRNIFRGHTVNVASVDFSPNGRLVASASWDKLFVWNMRDGSVNVFKGPSDFYRDPPLFVNGGLRYVKFSPNGQYVVTKAFRGNLRIWSVRTGRLVKEWTALKGGIWGMVFMPDGRSLLIGGDDGVVKCLDVSSLGLGMCQSDGGSVLPEILQYGGHKILLFSSESVAVSPDARWVSSSSNKTVVLWDTRRSLECTLIGHEDVVSSVDFSPDGSYLALGSHDCHVTLWRYTET